MVLYTPTKSPNTVINITVRKKLIPNLRRPDVRDRIVYNATGIKHASRTITKKYATRPASL